MKNKTISEGDFENSFINLFRNCKVLFLVPHEDDEINVARGFIYQLSQSGVECRVVYTTNGDWFVKTRRRQNEAYKALKVCGLRKKDVIFLGYPDIGDNSANCVYLSRNGKCYESRDGRDQTYLGKGRQEYCILRDGIHRKYTYENYLADICNLIEDFRPDYLVCNDMDSHVNHKEVSALVEEAVVCIRKREKGYTPILLKTLAYGLAYYAPNDYLGYNLCSTVDCENKFNQRLRWDERVRFPVPACCRTKRIVDNLIYRALWKHHSQGAYMMAERVANSDNIFWMFRTDSVTYSADVVVSSGNAAALNDGRVCTLDHHMNVSYDLIWSPLQNDSHKSCRFELGEPKDIEEVIIYENPLPGNDILKAELRFSNGDSFIIDALNHDGYATHISLEKREQILWVEFSILEAIGESAGLVELEILPVRECKEWFSKISIDGNYIYDNYYYDINQVGEMHVEVYTYDTNGRRITKKGVCGWEKDRYILQIGDEERIIASDGMYDVGSLSFHGNDNYIKLVDRKCGNVIDEIHMIQCCDLHKLELKEKRKGRCKMHFHKVLDWIVNEFYHVRDDILQLGN